MVDKKKLKFLSKNIKFGKSTLTLFSLDGITWSSRKEELSQILERHEMERQKIQSNMGEAKLEEGAETEQKATSDDEGGVIMETTEDDSEKTPKRAGKQIKDLERKKPVKNKAQVKFVTPKPRQLEKKRGKGGAAKSKKRAA